MAIPKALPTSTGFLGKGEWLGAVNVPDMQIALEKRPALKRKKKVDFLLLNRVMRAQCLYTERSNSDWLKTKTNLMNQ